MNEQYIAHAIRINLRKRVLELTCIQFTKLVNIYCTKYIIWNTTHHDIQTIAHITVCKLYSTKHDLTLAHGTI